MEDNLCPYIGAYKNRYNTHEKLLRLIEQWRSFLDNKEACWHNSYEHIEGFWLIILQAIYLLFKVMFIKS